MQDADGQTLQFEYDGEGNQTGLLDAKGVWTRWAYDGDGRVRLKTYADGATEKWNYQGWDGRLVSSVNGRNAQTNYAYDSWSQISGIDYPNSADVSLNYDALGRTIGMTDGIGTTTWTFDASGRAASEDGPFANDTVTYGYDSLSRLNGRSVQRDANTADVTNFGYDNLGRLSAVAQTNGAWGAVNGARGNTWNWTYQGDTGKPLATDAPNGTHTDYAYESGNTLQRLIGVSNKVSANGAVLSQFSYAYGSTAAGTSNGQATGFRDNRVAASKQYGAVAANAQTTSYGYNQTSMLTGEAAPAKSADLPALSQSYAFDAMGNRTQWSDGVAKTLTNAVYNRLNQLTGTSSYNNTTPASPVLLSTSAFGYDGDGNMTNVATTTGTTTTNGVYRYDDASRLIAIESPGQSKTEFFYDGVSRLRVSRTWVWQGGVWVPQAEKRRVYVGMDVVQERDGNNAVVTSYARTGNIGGMLARTTSSGSSFYDYDGAGNVTTLTDAAGAQVGSYTYDAWGNTVTSSGTKAGENPYRFSTKEAIGGLYSYGFRFYSPGIGRWINRDPISESGGKNLYGFVGNNPLNYVDSNGLIPQAVVIGAALGGLGALVGNIWGQVSVLRGANPSLSVMDALKCVDWERAVYAGLIGLARGALIAAFATGGAGEAALVGMLVGAFANGLGYAVDSIMADKAIDGTTLTERVIAGAASGALSGIGTSLGGGLEGKILSAFGSVTSTAGGQLNPVKADDTGCACGGGGSGSGSGGAMPGGPYIVGNGGFGFGAGGGYGSM